MLELIKKNELLYVQVLLNLRLAVPYENKEFKKGERKELLLPEEVKAILIRNGNIKLFNGEKYIKLNLGQFHDVMKNKNYVVKDYVEPKKEVKVEQPKVEPKKEEVVVEAPKDEPKKEVVEQPKQGDVVVETPKAEQPKKEYKNDNKKQRHNNNNNNNNQQGGDK